MTNSFIIIYHPVHREHELVDELSDLLFSDGWRFESLVNYVHNPEIPRERRIKLENELRQ